MLLRIARYIMKKLNIDLDMIKPYISFAVYGFCGGFIITYILDCLGFLP